MKDIKRILSHLSSYPFTSGYPPGPQASSPATMELPLLQRIGGALHMPFADQTLHHSHCGRGRPRSPKNHEASLV